jgi:hypothetical protein
MRQEFIPRDKVRLATGTIGDVVSVLLEETQVRYCVAYFVNGEHKTEWFYDFELVKLAEVSIEVLKTMPRGHLRR